MSNRRSTLRVIEIDAPAWAEGKTKMREPRIRDYNAAAAASNDQEKTVKLLGCMVLDDDGKPVGEEAILDAGLSALAQLAKHVPGLLGDEQSGPLDQGSGSSTV